MSWSEIVKANTAFINGFGKPSANFHPNGTSIFAGFDWYWIFAMLIVGLIVFAILIRLFTVFQPKNAGSAA